MDQRTAVSADPTLLRHVRTALLVLGGAVGWWLVLLSGGTAHADDTGQAARVDHALRVDHAPLGRASEVLKRTTRGVSGQMRTTPTRVTQTLTSATRTAPEPARTTVQRVTTALEPTLAATTDTLAKTVDHTVDRAVETATGTPV